MRITYVAYFFFEMKLNFWMSWDALLYALKITLNANACHLQILWGLPSVFNMQCSKPVFQLDMAALCSQKKGLTKWPLNEKDLDCLYMFQLGQSILLIRFCSTDHIRCASALKIIASDTLWLSCTMKFQILIYFRYLLAFLNICTVVWIIWFLAAYGKSDCLFVTKISFLLVSYSAAPLFLAKKDVNGVWVAGCRSFGKWPPRMCLCFASNAILSGMITRHLFLSL